MLDTLKFFLVFAIDAESGQGISLQEKTKEEIQKKSSDIVDGERC